jgi:hypothetical protein
MLSKSSKNFQIQHWFATRGQHLLRRKNPGALLEKSRFLHLCCQFVLLRGQVWQTPESNDVFSSAAATKTFEFDDTKVILHIQTQNVAQISLTCLPTVVLLVERIHFQESFAYRVNHFLGARPYQQLQRDVVRSVERYRRFLVDALIQHTCLRLAIDAVRFILVKFVL